jgi:hypothetical protein
LTLTSNPGPLLTPAPSHPRSQPLLSPKPVLCAAHVRTLKKRHLNRICLQNNLQLRKRLRAVPDPLAAVVAVAAAGDAGAAGASRPSLKPLLPLS